MPQKADAFFALFLRFLGLGRLGVGSAASVAGRSIIRGTAPIRPIVRRSTWNSYRQGFQTAQWVLRAGRLIRTDGISHEVAYNDQDEYQYDLAYYPQYFETVGAALSVDNSDPCDAYYLPESSLVLTDDDNVWQAYDVPEIYVPPGGRTIRMALPGVPLGWGFTGTYEADDESISSDYIPA
jgi:hypothetical protein